MYKIYLKNGKTVKADHIYNKVAEEDVLWYKHKPTGEWATSKDGILRIVSLGAPKLEERELDRADWDLECHV